MVKSIKYFEEKCINKFEELENKFLKDPTRIAEYVLGLTSEDIWKVYQEVLWTLFQKMNFLVKEAREEADAAKKAVEQFWNH